MQLLRFNEANAALDEIGDPVTRELVRAALATVFFKFLRRETGADIASLPVSPFDALFFVRTMASYFEPHDHIRRMLDGEVIDPFG